MIKLTAGISTICIGSLLVSGVRGIEAMTLAWGIGGLEAMTLVNTVLVLASAVIAAICIIIDSGESES